MKGEEEWKKRRKRKEGRVERGERWRGVNEMRIKMMRE